MPAYPDEAVQRAAEVLFRQYESQYSAGHLTWRDFTDPAREVLDAAAPLLAEAVAQQILAHMEHHGPRRGSRLGGKAADQEARYAWRRHLGIAARIAAGAFTTEAESKQTAAQALVSGDYVACDIPEDGGQQDA